MSTNTQNQEDFDAMEAAAAAEISVSTGSAYAEMKDLLGCLLLIRPYAEGTRPSKRAGQQDYPWVETDTYVLQAPDGGEGEFPTSFFDDPRPPFVLEAFQFMGKQPTEFLLRKLHADTPSLGLGVLIKGEASEKGNSDPWILETPDQDQIRLAARYWMKHKADKAAAKMRQAASGNGTATASDWS